MLYGAIFFNYYSSTSRSHTWIRGPCGEKWFKTTHWERNKNLLSNIPQICNLRVRHLTLKWQSWLISFASDRSFFLFWYSEKDEISYNCYKIKYWKSLYYITLKFPRLISAQKLHEIILFIIFLYMYIQSIKNLQSAQTLRAYCIFNIK